MANNNALKSYDLSNSGVIRDILERPDGTLLASKNDGLFQYDRDNDKWMPWSDYSNVSVASLFQDPDSTLWISTHGKGLIRMKGDTSFAYTMQNGLHTNAVHYVVDDLVGHLWIGTENGLIRVSRSSADSVFAGLKDQLDPFCLHNRRWITCL